MAGHVAGDILESYSVPITLKKTPALDETGNAIFGPDGKPQMRCGFRIGGGIDQDNQQSPQGYLDKGVYVTFVYENGPAAQAGLRQNDKLLQVNGHDMTMVTHKKAVDYVSRKPVLQMMVYRAGMGAQSTPVASNYQGQQYHGTPMNQSAPAQGYQHSPGIRQY